MRKRTTYHHGDLRNALVTAALALIAEKGVEGFTLRDCAKKAGVSVAAPYRHFTDRDDLLAAVAADCMQRLGAAMDRALEAVGDVDPLSAFRATGIAYVRFAVEHPAHFRVMNMPQVIARTPPEVRAQVDAWAGDMTARLAAAQRAGTLIALPLEQIMLAASAVTHGLAHMIVDDVDGLGSLDPDAAAQLAVDVTGVIGLGLLPRTGADAKLPAPPTKPPRRKPRGRGGAAVLVAIALGSGRADAKPAPPLVAAAAELPAAEYVGSAKPDDPSLVLVPAAAAALPAGTYLLVGTRGPVGALALDRGAGRDCPHGVTLHLTAAPAWTPGEADHLVVVGPLDPAAYPKARLQRSGLATAGHLAAEAEDPLGVAPPRGVVPTYAIDLDGDAAADLVIEAQRTHGRFVRGVAKVSDTVAVWTRAGTRWTRTARCRWTGTDTIE